MLASFGGTAVKRHGRDWVGHSVYVRVIAATAYMAGTGPKGFEDVGGRILQRVHYAVRRLTHDR